MKIGYMLKLQRRLKRKATGMDRSISHLRPMLGQPLVVMSSSTGWLWTTRSAREAGRHRRSVGPLVGVAMAEHPGESTELGDDQDLDDHIADEPGQLRHLARRVGDSLDATQVHPLVLRHRA